jgi:insulysin
MGGYSTASRGFGFFEIMVDLTQDGFENIDEIVKIVFQYINLLKRDGIQKWIFEEYCNVSEMQFRFKEKENPLSLVSSVVIIINLRLSPTDYSIMFHSRSILCKFIH